MNRKKATEDTPALTLVDFEEEHAPAEHQPQKEDDEKEVKAFRNDALYWKSRALAAESLGVKDNVTSALVAFKAIVRMCKEDYSEEGADALLLRIRTRAGMTVQAIEATRKSEE